jgi:two-component system, chemotaxis family, sensor kinase CheA
MDMSKYRGMFLSETEEHLKNMNRLLLQLEKAPADRESIDSLFREVHSIKGMAASMGYTTTASLAHHLEDLMDSFRKGGSITPEAVDRMLAGLDLLEGLVEDLTAEQPERGIESFLRANPAASAPEPAPAAGFPSESASAAAAADSGGGEREALQVEISLAEGVVAPAARAILLLRELGRCGAVQSSSPAVEELQRGATVGKLSAWLVPDLSPVEIEGRLRAMPDVAEVQFGADRRREGSARRDEGARTVRVRTDLLDRFINLTGELITNRYQLQGAARSEQWGEVKNGLGQLSRLLTDLHHHVLQVRMMPVESITGRLPRVVRDLARKAGKEIVLTIKGEEVELDRAILEELADPLVHMVRNAVDHGIDRQGTVTVRAWREKDLVLIEVADDGRGMDLERIRGKILEKKLLTQAQLKSLHDRDVLQWVCHPGFSTARQITETSGRGVGMDVVKSAVENLGGILDIRSKPGEGTRILLQLPLSVAIIKVLLVESGGHTMAIPITRVLRTMEVQRREVHSSGRQLVIRLEEDLVPLLSLRKILGLPTAPREAGVPVVITELRGRRVGLVVDRLAGQREVFVKPLAFPLDQIAGLSGAAVLGDGHIVFLLDPQTLLETRPGAGRGQHPGEAR